MTFGISGRLYKSNVLLYDHQTESLWSQLMNTSISGPLAAKEMTPLASFRTKWKTWKHRNPKTMVLSDDTGYHRNYAIDPYEGYYRVGTIMFPVGEVRRDLPAKEPVLGISIGDRSKAYALNKLKAQPGSFNDQIGATSIQITISPEGEVVSVRDQKGNDIAAIYAYWFAWQAFHPDTEVYKSGPK